MATVKVVNGQVLAADSTPRIGVLVKAKLSQPVTIAGTQEVVPLEVTTRTAPNGTYSLSLFSNSDLTPSGTYYTITEDAQSGDSYAFVAIVPGTAGPFNAASIQAAAPAPSPPAALDSAVVHNTGAEAVAGVKTFSSAPVVPAAAFPESAIASLTTDLAAKAADAAVVHLAGTETMTGDKVHSGRLTLTKDFVHSVRTATEAELVSGLDASLAETVYVALTANRVMGAPINPVAGHRMKVVFTEDATGGRTVTLPSAVVAPNWTLNLGANANTELPLEYNGTTSKWLFASNPPSLKSNFTLYNLVTDYAGDPTGAASAVTPLTNMIAGLTGNAAPASNTRTAVGTGFVPAGTFKVDADLLIQSVQGFHLLCAGIDQTIFKLTGSGFTSAGLNIDGSAFSVYEGFTILGDGTETVTNAILLQWTAGASRSTTENTFRNIHIRNLKFINGINCAGHNQVDSTQFHGVSVSGNSNSDPTYWQNAWLLGDGVAANNLNHFFFDTEALLCVNGYHVNASNMYLWGAEIGSNAVDFFLQGPTRQCTIEGVESESSGRLVFSSGGGAAQGASFRDVTFNQDTINADGKWINLQAPNGPWVFDNVLCRPVGSAVLPVISLQGSGTHKLSVSLRNVTQKNTFAAGVTPIGNACVLFVENYVQIDASSNPVAGGGFTGIFNTAFMDALQAPTEAVLVSGLDASLGSLVKVTLTAARLVGAPLNPNTGQRLTLTLVQDGTGGWAVTWNAVFKVSWADTGNTLNKRSTISFVYDGTNWNQDGAQTPYV